MQLSDAFIETMRGEFPAFRIVNKSDSLLSAAIDLALKVLTFGQQREYLTHYHTVLGDTLYVPGSWATMGDRERLVVLRHERVHLRQRRRYGFLTFALLYLIPWFPMGLAWGRARLEWEAYAETLRATAELFGIDAVRDPELRRKIVGRFTGPAYGWMWPFTRRVEAWYDEVVGELAKAPRQAPPSMQGDKTAIEV